MHKWHTNAVVGRARFSICDSPRLSEGIALSLRQFHISASRYDGEGNASTPAPTPRLRFKKSSENAHQEIQSLGNKATTSPNHPNTTFRKTRFSGVDARSFAARPSIRGTGNPGSGIVRGHGATRGGPSRGGPSRGGPRTRGTRSRGERAAPGDKNNERTPRLSAKARREAENAEFQWLPEEQEWLEMVEKRDAPKSAPFAPSGSISADLEGKGPAVIPGDRGKKEIIEEGIHLVTGREAGQWKAVTELAERLLAGEFVQFESDQERDITVKEAERLCLDRAKKLSDRKGEVVEKEDITFEPISEEDRMLVLAQHVQGKYTALPNSVRKSGILEKVAMVTGSNATYRPHDSDALLAKVKTMLPAPKSQASKTSPKQASKGQSKPKQANVS